jgi:hypothetical protein
MSEDNRRLRVPGVLIHRDGELYAALEPSEVEEEHARPELFFYTAYWRLLIRSGESWQDAGYATSQTESGRGFLARRVTATVAAFDGKVIDDFSFRMTVDSLPQVSGRISTDSIDRDDPVVARLRKVCHGVANTVTNAQQSSKVLYAFADGAEYVIEMKDGFDYSDYYIPVMPGQDPQALIARETSGGMQRFMGMLSRERAEQIWPELAAERSNTVPDASAAPGDEPRAQEGLARRIWSRLIGRAD